MPLDPATIDAMLAAGLSAEQMAAVMKAELVADQAAAAAAVASGEPLIPTPHIRPAVRQAVIARDGFVCAYCSCEVAVPHLDHVVPWTRGGLSTVSNLVVSCRSCNAAKKDRTPQEWGGARGGNR